MRGPVDDVRAALKEAEDREAIKRLKYKYMRCVDTKQWADLMSCFAENARTSYEGGKYPLEGHDAILGFFKKMSSPELITVHHLHHPEIELTGDDTARGAWALEDYVIDLKANWSLRGAAFYEDEYVRVNGEWKIKFTGFKRIFWERHKRSDLKSLKLIENMHALPHRD